MNVSEYRPANNDFNYLEGSQELRDSVALLKSYIKHHPPELIITFGEQALRTLTGNFNINNWRSSPLYYEGIKLLPTFHPGQWGIFTTLQFDLNKSIDYLNNKHTVYNDNFTITADPLEQRNLIPEILASEYVTIDIETKRDADLSLLCIGFGLSNNRAICFVNRSESTKHILAELIPQIARPIYHNALFDVSVLRSFHNIPAGPAYFDTLLAQHVLEPELPRGLDFLCTALTWRPCYWGSVKFDAEEKSWSSKRSLDDLYIYNCLDTVVTYEAFLSQQEELKSNPRLNEVFKYEVEMLEVSMHMTSTGFCVDNTRLSLLKKVIEDKKQNDYVFLSAILGKPVLISSPKQVKDLLYTELGLPTRRNQDGTITTGEDALVSLIGYCKTEQSKLKTNEARTKWDMKVAILKLILNIRGYEKLLSSYINVGISADGRLRGIFKVGATESGRWAGGVWYDGTGLNAQTLPRESIEYEASDS